MPKLRVFQIGGLVVALGVLTVAALLLFKGPMPAPITRVAIPIEDATRWVIIPADKYSAPVGPVLRAGDPIPWVNKDAESQAIAGDDGPATDQPGIGLFNKNVDANGTSWLQLSSIDRLAYVCQSNVHEHLVHFERTIPSGPKGIARNTISNLGASISAW